MKHIIFIIMICSIDLFGQTVGYDLENSFEQHFKKEGFYYHDSDCDTLLIDSQNYFFKRSPISYYKGYTKIFTDKEVLVVAIPFSAGNKGYTVTWIIKNKKLYIKKLTLFELGSTFKRTATGKIIEMPYNKLNENDINRRIENFTGEKFNKDGLLPATWVNGELGLIKLKNETNQESRKYFHDFIINNHNYNIIFKNGKLKEIKPIAIEPYILKMKKR